VMSSSCFWRAKPAFALSANAWLPHHDSQLKKIAEGWKDDSFQITTDHFKFKLILRDTDERHLDAIAKFPQLGNLGPAVVEAIRGWALTGM
jgi:hypothetical protein